MSDIVEPHASERAERDPLEPERSRERNENPRVVRAADEADAPTLLAFLHRKAAFDRETGGSDGALATSEDAIRATLFGATPYAWSLIAEQSDVVVGFALYYFRYSSFRGQPSLWLDDLYVLEAARSRGTGAALMAELVSVAKRHGCSHLGWTAAVRNSRGIAFYERLGARIAERGATQVRFELAL